MEAVDTVLVMLRHCNGNDNMCIGCANILGINIKEVIGTVVVWIVNICSSNNNYSNYESNKPLTYTTVLIPQELEPLLTSPHPNPHTVTLYSTKKAMLILLAKHTNSDSCHIHISEL